MLTQTSLPEWRDEGKRGLEGGGGGAEEGLMQVGGGRWTQTWELNGEALLAGEEVGAELQDDRVEGAVQVLGQGRAAELLQQDPALRRPVPDAQDVVDLLCVEHQEVEPAWREEAGGQAGLSPFLPVVSGQGKSYTEERLAGRNRKRCPAVMLSTSISTALPTGGH